MRFRLLDFTVALHYSLLIGFCLISWALSTTYFTQVLSALSASQLDRPWWRPVKSAGTRPL